MQLKTDSPMIRLTLQKRFFSSLVFLMLIANLAQASATDTLKYSVFGKVIVYKPATVVNAVVLFISGETGWNKNLEIMTRNMVTQGAIVVGIDCRNYLKKLKSQSLKCYYPAGDLEELSMFLQKKYFR